jgi:hypothetical protein
MIGRVTNLQTRMMKLFGLISKKELLKMITTLETEVETILEMTEDEEEANSEHKRNLVVYRQKDRTIVNNNRSITNRFLASLALVSVLIACIYIPPMVYRN